jgi:hypothetical protein
VISVRAYDDMIAMVYIFLEYYIGNQIAEFRNNIIQYDEYFVNTYGNRKKSSFKKLIPVTLLEKIYKESFNLEENQDNILSPYLKPEIQLKVLNGSMERDDLYNIISFATNIFKFKYFNYDTFKDKIPKWLNKFIQSLGVNNIFNVDIKQKLDDLYLIKQKYYFKNMSKDSIIKIVQKYPEYYNPMFGISK